ncbi:membrane protease subunit [Parvularcula marina]|uniref:Membrane protease subunit n=1 Tax=Parvularcula marina TaxID=2292771 RepID=A0A371RF95_9PROT|nr:membrane protease subunit [Parvularcula marina]RFB04124.1 membrane protease subunit [Parvularcula marina]
MKRTASALGSLILIIAIGAAAMYILPQWNVWRADLAGQAALAEAENARKVQIEEAKAQLESARYYAEAEIERAKGVAEANDIIADGLGGPDGYLRYLWIQKLGQNNQDVIYIPTEAGIPILEAGRIPMATE